MSSVGQILAKICSLADLLGTVRVMAKSAKAPGGGDGLTVRLVTINQLVGYNMGEYRKAAGLTQEELGQRLGGWTKVAVSAAERSWDGKRVRKFDADELVAIARALGVPVPALFLPPENAGTAVRYELAGTSEIEQHALLTDLLPYFLPASDDQSPAMTAFRNRLMALDANFPSKADEAMTIVDDARLRAESLQRDAREHQAAVASLAVAREELVRRIDELRIFERQYRSTLTAFLERQLSELRAGVDDKRRFVLVKGSTGKYHFNLVAANGQVVATSQSYEDKQSALNGIASVRYAASGAGIADQT